MTDETTPTHECPGNQRRGYEDELPFIIHLDASNSKTAQLEGTGWYAFMQYPDVDDTQGVRVYYCPFCGINLDSINSQTKSSKPNSSRYDKLEL